MCSPPSRAPTSARPRRASNISSSARLPRGILLYGISPALRLHRHDQFDGIAAALRARRHAVDRPAVRPGVRARRPRLQDQRGAVPHVDARRLRRRADAGHRLLRLGAQGRRGAAAASASALEALGPGDRRLAADRDLRRAGLDRPRRGRARIGQTNIKRLLAYSSINNVGFALIGLAAGGAAGASSVLFYMAVYVVMTLGAFLVRAADAQDEDGEPVESDRQPVGPVAARARASPRRLAIFMFSLAGIPPLFGFWPQVAGVPGGGRRRA